MKKEEKLELLRLLEERTLSDWARRKRRLERIPLSSVAEALERDRKGLPLTTEQYIASHLGFLPPHSSSKRYQPSQSRNQPPNWCPEQCPEIDECG